MSDDPEYIFMLATTLRSHEIDQLPFPLQNEVKYVQKLLHHVDIKERPLLQRVYDEVVNCSCGGYPAYHTHSDLTGSGHLRWSVECTRCSRITAFYDMVVNAILEWNELNR